jgi:hypothetical protein
MGRKTRILLAAGVMGVAWAVVIGCGRGDASGRQAVSGTVTLHGAPLDQGEIQFTSLEPGKSEISGAMITSGKFSVPGDKGLPPGKYRVRISSADPGSAAAAPEMPGEAVEVAKDRIPPEFGAESKQEVTVTKGGPNVFEFNIK